MSPKGNVRFNVTAPTMIAFMLIIMWGYDRKVKRHGDLLYICSLFFSAACARKLDSLAEGSQMSC